MRHLDETDTTNKGLPGPIRRFETGATRDTEDNKLDYEGFLSPVVLQAYAQYMHKHRYQADGELRASDNWTKGIPRDVYMKSAWRHFMDWWLEHRGYPSREGLEDALCGLLFNVMGYLHELKAHEASPSSSLPETRLLEDTLPRYVRIPKKRGRNG